MDFGHIKIPRDLKKPAPEVADGYLHSDKPGTLRSKAVSIVDTETFKIEDFTFDGTVTGKIFFLLKHCGLVV